MVFCVRGFCLKNLRAQILPEYPIFSTTLESCLKILGFEQITGKKVIHGSWARNMPSVSVPPFQGMTLGTDLALEAVHEIRAMHGKTSTFSKRQKTERQKPQRSA